jgi:hypothetical protein
MPGTTSKGLRYPTAGDNPAVHTDFLNLATDIDTELDGYLTTAAATATLATVPTEDTIRTINFMLGGM